MASPFSLGLNQFPAIRANLWNCFLPAPRRNNLPYMRCPKSVFRSKLFQRCTGISLAS